jgi:hypothetical protein
VTATETIYAVPPCDCGAAEKRAVGQPAACRDSCAMVVRMREIDDERWREWDDGHEEDA